MSKVYKLNEDEDKWEETAPVYTAPTQTPQSTFDEKAKEILEYLAESYYPEHEYGDMQKGENAERIDEALAAIKALVLEEAVGEDKNLTPSEMYGEHDENNEELKIYRNGANYGRRHLRAQQRSIITKGE